MKKEFCDLCEKEVTDDSIGRRHWCGNFVIDGVHAEIWLKFDAELCMSCRTRFEKTLQKQPIEHWVPGSLGL